MKRRNVKKIWPAVTLIFVVLVFIAFIYPRFNFKSKTGIEVSASSEPGVPRIQEVCGEILGDNPGAVLVYDLKEKKALAVVNPEIAFRKAYRPGSLFKLATAAALLENGKIDRGQSILCRNYFKYAGREYTCSEPGGHGMVDLASATGHSCSVYFYNFALRLNSAELKNTAYKMGIGRSLKTPDSEITCVPGNLDPPEDPREFLDFAVGDHDGVKITPFHAANIAAIVASGDPLSPGLPAPGFSRDTLDLLEEGMAIAAGEGTCSEIGRAGIDAAGKTGTAASLYDPDKVHGWFIGYMPKDDPEYVVVVFLEDGKGYIDAVPMGVKILKKMCNYRLSHK